MRTTVATILALIAAVCLSAAAVSSAQRVEPLVIDHTCTDLAAIPHDAIQTAKDSCKWHYARLSHGRQLTEGMSRIERADPFYAAIWPSAGGSLPEVPNTLCIYSSPQAAEGYWQGSGLDRTRTVLAGTPELNISAFSWCTELNTATASYVNQYLSAMQTLESEFPDVTFIYFTGTAQDGGGYGYNRYLRNKQIRDFCTANSKVLYDFEDLDSWWLNPDTGEWEHSTYEYNGATVPVEHPNLAGNDAEHTSYASCEQKGRATWWMMATLSGWSETTAVGDDGSADGTPPAAPYRGFELSCHPNPFNPTTTITFSMKEPGRATLAVYDVTGALVRTLLDGYISGGTQSVRWNGTDESGAPVASGVYFSRVTADKKTSTKKVILLR
jgi:hypothetical protein